MKKFIIIFKFELFSYIKNKSFIISTFLIAILIMIIMFLPRFFDMSEFTGVDTNLETTVEEEKKVFGIVDKGSYVTDKNILNQFFENVDFVFINSEEELKNLVQKEEIETGFCVQDENNFRYYVLNSDIQDNKQQIFSEIMNVVRRQSYCADKNINYEELVETYEQTVNCDEIVLGKNAINNYLYSYVLIVVLYIVIAMYCGMVATAVTVEKSNRSIEILVTSVNSKYLLYGKIFAGIFAAIIQLLVIFIGGSISYKANSSIWGKRLDMLFDIPIDVLITFIMFGLAGFVLFAFIYGALGALVSKTEDVSKSINFLQLIITVIYIIVLLDLENVDGKIIRICSYLPISSWATMFVRVGMGQVSIVEIIISFILLIITTWGIGWLGSKIYRMGTLHYGKPLKLKKVLKRIFN